MLRVDLDVILSLFSFNYVCSQVEARAKLIPNIMFSSREMF